MRAFPSSSWARRTKCARITCEHARKPPRRCRRANILSAASLEDLCSTESHAALGSHRVRTPPGEVAQPFARGNSRGPGLRPASATSGVWLPSTKASRAAPSVRESLAPLRVSRSASSTHASRQGAPVEQTFSRRRAWKAYALRRTPRPTSHFNRVRAPPGEVAWRPFASCRPSREHRHLRGALLDRRASRHPKGCDRPLP